MIWAYGGSVHWIRLVWTGTEMLVGEYITRTESVQLIRTVILYTHLHKHMTPTRNLGCPMAVTLNDYTIILYSAQESKTNYMYYLLIEHTWYIPNLSRPCFNSSRHGDNTAVALNNSILRFSSKNCGNLPFCIILRAVIKEISYWVLNKQAPHKML